jgi:hypothetical protein
VDAIATPFVQGQLRNERLECSIQTECAHCGRSIHLEMDSDLNYAVREKDAAPLIFAPPLVDFDRLEAPNIIDAF